MKVTENLVREINKALVGFEVVPNPVKKNNIERIGLTVVPTEGDRGICPTLYIEDMKSKEEVISCVNRVITKDKPNIDIDVITSREFILSHVRACLVSDDNIILDDDVVSRPFLDMAITYRIVFDGFEQEAQGSILIRNAILERAGITEDELFEVVRKSTDFEMKSLFDTLVDLLELEDDMVDNMGFNLPGLYVLTSKDKMQGASVLITDLLADVRKKFNSDFYILPSSIHEVIVLSVDNVDVNELLEMVKTINATEVRPEDRLTDSVYIYGADGLRKAA